MVSEDNAGIFDTLALLPKIYTQKVVYNALFKGLLPLVLEIEEKLKKGDKLWVEGPLVASMCDTCASVYTLRSPKLARRCVRIFFQSARDSRSVHQGEPRHRHFTL